MARGDVVLEPLVLGALPSRSQSGFKLRKLEVGIVRRGPVPTIDRGLLGVLLPLVLLEEGIDPTLDVLGGTRAAFLRPPRRMRQHCTGMDTPA